MTDNSNTDGRSTGTSVSTGNAKSSNSTTAAARQRAIEAYDSARGSVSDTVSDAPLLVLAGGIAAGALLAAFLPRTEAEDRLIQPTARRVRESARAAADAARQTGSQRLGDFGLTPDKAEETIRSLLDNVAEVARDSATAALDAAKQAG